MSAHHFCVDGWILRFSNTNVLMHRTGFQKWSPQWSFHENVSLPFFVTDRNRGLRIQWCHALYGTCPVRPWMSIVLQKNVVEEAQSPMCSLKWFFFVCQLQFKMIVLYYWEIQKMQEILKTNGGRGQKSRLKNEGQLFYCNISNGLSLIEKFPLKKIPKLEWEDSVVKVSMFLAGSSCIVLPQCRHGFCGS